MHYFATADTDIGNTKSTNQDSLLIKHASYCGGEVMLAVICDGMGGLSKGELASATVIKEFSKWFDEELPYELEKLDMNVIGEKWSLLLKELNIRIIEYGQLNHISLGTTFTGILMVNDKYVIGHVGDTRVYFIGNGMMQLTEDQTFVAREIKKGTMTPEQAVKDKRRNMLLQCVGASENLEPEIIVGGCMRGTYMVGTSVTALDVEWEQQWLGDEMLGLNSDVEVKAGDAGAKADIGVQLYGEDGKLKPQFGASAKAEATAAELEGSLGVNVLGGEVGVSGSVSVGVGAHADVGYKDGVFKFDIGASVGLGVSVGSEVDIGGMVDTVCDAAESAWNGLEKGWKTATSWFK